MTGTAVATIHDSSVRQGLPVSHQLGPAFFPPWLSRQVGFGPVAQPWGESSLTIATSKENVTMVMG